MQPDDAPDRGGKSRTSSRSKRSRIDRLGSAAVVSHQPVDRILGARRHQIQGASPRSVPHFGASAVSKVAASMRPRTATAIGIPMIRIAAGISKVTPIAPARDSAHWRAVRRAPATMTTSRLAPPGGGLAAQTAPPAFHGGGSLAGNESASATSTARSTVDLHRSSLDPAGWTDRERLHLNHALPPHAARRDVLDRRNESA